MRSDLLPLLSLALLSLFPSQRASALTLSEAMDRAAANTEAAELLEIDVRTAEAREQQALGVILPRLTATGSTTRNDSEVSFGGRTIATLFDSSANARLTLDLFRGPSIPEYRATRETSQATRLRQRWESAGLRLAAGRAFLAALTARENRDAALRSLEVRQASLRQTEALSEVGFALQADLSQAQLSVLDAETEVLDADMVLDNALDSLAFLVDVPAVAADELQAPLEMPPGGGDEADRRADLRALDHDFEAQSARVLGQWLSFLPVLELAGQYNIGPESLRAPDGTFWTISLTATWIVFDWGRYGRLDEAQAGRDARDVTRTEAERQLGTDMRVARRRLEVADARLDLAEESARVAAETRDLQAEQYALGDLTALEMIEADDAVFRAEQALNLAQLERDLSRLEVSYLIGGLEEPQADGS